MSRNYSMDYLKALAILAVVVIHTSPLAGVSLGGYDLTPMNDVLNTLARFAVPVFFVMSGYLLMQGLMMSSGEEQRGKFLGFIKRNVKTLVVWLSLFYIFTGIMKSITAFLTGKSVSVTIKTYLIETISIEHIWLYMHKGLLRFDAAYQMWFMVALVVVAIIFYLFFKMNKVGVLLGIALLLHVIGLTGQSYKEIIEFPFDWRTRDAFFFGLFYFTMGAWFAKGTAYLTRLKARLSNKVLVILICLWAMVTVFERMFFTEVYGVNYAADFYLGNILQIFFLMLWVVKNANLFANSKFKVFGENSQYIFLTHTLVIYMLKYILDALGFALNQSLLASLLYVPFVFVVSYYLYKLINKMKEMMICILRKV